MYTIVDKSAAIRNVQKFLGLRENGIYDSITRTSVERFQTDRGLPMTGIVNYRTFDLLRESYVAKSEQENFSRGVRSARFPYRIGDYGKDVERITFDISDFLQAYSYPFLVPRGAIYNENTERAVASAREILGMQGESGVDAALYARIMREILTENGSTNV